MEFDLRSESGESFRLSSLSWRFIQEFAEMHGFRWPADYRGDDCSSLGADESIQLANALEQGLGTGQTDKIVAGLRKQLAKQMNTDERFLDELSARIDAHMVNHWQEFIAFARRGGFSQNL